MNFTVDQFTSDAAVRTEAATALGVSPDNQAVTNLITNAFNSSVESLAGATTLDSAKLIVSAAATAQAASGVTPANPQAVATGATVSKSNLAVTDAAKAASLDALSKQEADFEKNRKAIKLVSILTRKPAVYKRLEGQTTMTIVGSNATLTKLEGYKNNANSPEDAAIIDEMITMVKKAIAGETVTTEIAINENAKPVVEGYKFEEGGTPTYVRKNKNGLKAYVLAKFGGYLPEETVGDMGVFLRATKVKTDASAKRISAIVTNTNEYWKSNEDGEKTFEIDTTKEPEGITVRSKLSAKIKDKDKVRTVRLSGTVKVKPVKRTATYVESLGQISDGIRSTNTAKSQDAKAQLDLASVMLAQLRNNPDDYNSEWAASLNAQLNAAEAAAKAGKKGDDV